MLTGTYTVRTLHQIATGEWGLRTRRNKREQGKPLALSGVYRLLTNPFYYGEFEYPHGSGLWYQGQHEPVITREDYQRVQRLLGRPGRPRPQTHAFAFTGLIRCGDCGAMVTAEEKWKRQQNGNVHHYLYYHCTKRKHPHCPQRSIEEQDLSRQIEAYLGRLQISERFKDWAITYLRELHEQEVSDRSAIYQNLHTTYTDTQNAVDELIRMKYRGLLEDDEYERERSRLKLELAHLKERLTDTEQRADHWLDLSEKAFEFACHAREWFTQGDLQVKKQILEAIGSNLVLKDKILSIEAKKPFVIIENGLKVLQAAFRRFEPLANGVDKEKREPLAAHLPAWRGLVEDVRTSVCETGLSVYFPSRTALTASG